MYAMIGKQVTQSLLLEFISKCLHLFGVSQISNFLLSFLLYSYNATLVSVLSLDICVYYTGKLAAHDFHVNIRG